MSSVTLEIRGLNPPFKVEQEDAGGFTKTFPDVPCVSQISGVLFSQDGLASLQDHDKMEKNAG